MVAGRLAEFQGGWWPIRMENIGRALEVVAWFHRSSNRSRLQREPKRVPRPKSRSTYFPSKRPTELAA